MSKLLYKNHSFPTSTHCNTVIKKMMFRKKSRACFRLESLKHIDSILSLYSINLTKTKIKRNVNFIHRIVIFLIWLLIIASDLYCLWRNLLTSNMFILLFNAMSFIMWCILSKNERKCAKAVCTIKRVRKLSKSHLRLSSPICIFLILTTVLTPVIVTLHNSILSLEKERCRDMWTPISNEILQTFLLIIQKTLRHFFTYGLFYFVTSFFFYICMELNSSVKCLTGDIINNYCSEERKNMLYYWLQL